MSHVVPSIVIDRMRAARERALEALAYLDQDMERFAETATTIRREIDLLLEIQESARTVAGSLPEVAAASGYSDSHVYGLVRAGIIENIAEVDQPTRVRYADVLAHRFREPAAESRVEATPRSRSHQPRAESSQTRSYSPRVKMRIIDDKAA